MAAIIKLTKEVSELIAAGEVVERPASAVKELVENAIDAGARMVTVEIERGGVRLIRVTDDGAGIPASEVSTAFLRNATSKIVTKEDLDNIDTLGFRGEALASIAAVSKIEMKTRTKEETLGTRVLLEGGTLLEEDETGAEVGTQITVRDLFFNTPARLKFLKSDVAEGNAVSACMDRLALSHPEVSFKLIRDRKATLFSPGNGDLLTTVYAVFGKEFAKSLVSLSFEKNGMKVHGLISRPEFSRGSRSMQFFFVNGRFVQTNTGQAALSEAYKNEVMVHKFPACVLFIDLPTNALDVNTHPAKIEVRFVQEKAVYEAIYFAVRGALSEKHEAPKLHLRKNPQETLLRNDAEGAKAKEQMSFYQAGTHGNAREDGAGKTLPSEQDSYAFKAQVREGERALLGKNEPGTAVFRQESATYERSGAGKSALPVSETESLRYLGVPPVISPNSFAGNEGAEHVADGVYQRASKEEPLPLQEQAGSEEKAESDAQKYAEIRYIGEVFATYVLFEKGDLVYFMDKHAAHERILFEQLREKSDPVSQVLLVPVAVTLPKEEYSLILEHSISLAEKGILVDDFGTGTVLVREFPSDLSGEDISAVLEEIASSLKNGKREIAATVWDDIFHSVACKAAIKGNGKHTKDELLSLIYMLEERKEIHHCPHGRPVVTVLQKKELEKRFGRI